MRCRNLLSLGLWLGLLGSSGLMGACSPTKFADDALYRALDRPVDLALVCAQAQCSGGTCTIDTLPLSTCSTATAESDCKVTENGTAPPQLIGFVANSERSELAIFSDCTGKLVDLDVSNPGQSLLPIGHLPVSVSAAADGCRVVSANAGSCDLSVVDAESLAGVAMGVRTPVDVAGEPIDPAEMVAQVAPLRYDSASAQWVALGVSPSQVVHVPPAVSQAVDGQVTEQACGPQQLGSAYAVFPGCDLVAEIDLVSGKILQSIQFVKDVSGQITTAATGSSPLCPVLDCPSQGLTPPTGTIALANLRPRTMELVSRYSYNCGTNEAEDDPAADPNAATCTPEYRALPAMSLIVAGAGADALFEIQSDEETGAWLDQVAKLDLPQAGGINRVRVSPPAPNPSPGCGGPSEAYVQFVYAIAGDGSTRVVARDFQTNDDQVGIECDTQIDPSGSDILECVCEPALAATNGDRPLRRRLLADGPGIRLPISASGAQPRVTDWTFYRVPSGSSSDTIEGLFSGEFANFLVGVGTTDTAYTVLTSIGHFARPLGVQRGLGFSPRVSGWTIHSEHPELLDLVDPMKTMALGLAPHNPVSFDAFSPLWPAGENSGGLGLPLLADQRLVRSGPARPEPHAILAPGLRSIDAAYGLEPESEESLPLNERLRVGPTSDSPRAWRDADKLGSGANALYANQVPRVITRDYLAWQPGAIWSLAWEGSIPGTASARGRLVCEKPGFEGSACLPQQAGQSRLVDDSTNFCNNGVLAGDKLAIVGCQADADCGEGQRCLKRSESSAEVSGICVSALAYDSMAPQLRALCSHFISDPCGEPVREFLITRAFEHELHLQVLDQPEISHLLVSSVDACSGGGRNNHPATVEGVATCVCDEGFVPCDGSADDGAPVTEVLDCCKQGADGVIIEDTVAAEVIDRFICLEEQPDGGCALDIDCNENTLEGVEQLSPAGQRYNTRYCIEGRCRRPCMGEQDAAQITAQDLTILGLGADAIVRDECSVRRLPGPACFQELVRYDVRARNSFVVRSDQLSTRYFTESVTSNDQGECVRRSPAEVSSLLTSRIPLGPDVANLGLPACAPGDQIPGVDSPNPCVETQPRLAENPGRFHYFSYESARSPVTSVRFSNPIFSLNLDLTHIESLLDAVPDSDEPWPAEFASFRRARIPRGYTMTFAAHAGRGYLLNTTRPTIDDRVSNPSQLRYPVRIVTSPVMRRFYVVDAGDRELAIAVRGQVMRLSWSDSVIGLIADPHFSGVR